MHCPHHPGHPVFIFGYAVVAALALQAQTSTVSPATPPAGTEDEPVELSIFEVRADPTDSYEALNTTSVTGTSKELSRLPITAEIFTEAVMRDLAITDVNELLRDYAAGMGAGIVGSAQFGEGSQEGDRLVGTFQMRGISVGAPRRNGLLGETGFLFDSFNLSRTEVIRGPQSLLYGAGTAAGIVNTTSKRATFGARSLELGSQFDSEGTVRFTADANYGGKLASVPFALRVNGVTMDKKYWRDNLRTETDGFAVAAAVRPFKALTLRAEVERVERFDVHGRTQAALRDRDSLYHQANLPLILAEGGVDQNLWHGRLTWENVNSLAGDFGANDQQLLTYSFSAEIRATDWLSAQVQYGKLKSESVIGFGNPVGGLYAPSFAANPIDVWAISYRPQVNLREVEQDDIRATVAAKFDFGRMANNELVFGAERKSLQDELDANSFYEVDANGAIIVNAAQRLNANDGRRPIPAQWISLENGIHAPFSLHDLTITDQLTGLTYRRAPRRTQNLVDPTPTNPFGINSGGGFFYTEIEEEAAFATLSSSWFKERIDFLLGYRVDRYTRDFVETGQRLEVEEGSRNLGLVFHATPQWALYYGNSDSYNPPSGVLRDFENKLLPAGRGTGHEAGLKFNLPGGRLSGSIAYFKIDSQGEIQQAAGQVVGISDPNGINGAVTPGAFSISFDREADGVEMALTASPIRGMSIRFSFSHVDGVEGSDVSLPIRYNDEFHANTSGQVTYSDGSVHTVRSMPTDPNSPLVPLTITMMKDPNSPYYAELDPGSGRIRNADDLGLNKELANGATIGTGSVGLPISAHQLGFQPPSGDTIVAKAGGDLTTGYPVDSFNLTASYRWQEGWLKGFELGSNIHGRFNQRAYYYNDTAAGNTRKLHMWDDEIRVNLWVAFTHQVGKRLQWRTQIQAVNLFDEVETRRYPSVANGMVQWATRQAPRKLVWVNSLRF